MARANPLVYLVGAWVIYLAITGKLPTYAAFMKSPKV